MEGKLHAGQVRGVSLVLYGLSSVIGIYLAATRGWELLWIGLIGAFGSLTYTAPPLKYKYSALGEISVFLMWGPLMVAGAYFVQRQAFSLNAFWISLPFGVLVGLVLLANNHVAYATGVQWALADAGRAAFERPVAVVLADDPHPHLFSPLRGDDQADTGIPADHLHGPTYLDVDEGVERFTAEADAGGLAIDCELADRPTHRPSRVL